jgi:hypothetical protein
LLAPVVEVVRQDEDASNSNSLVVMTARPPSLADRRDLD